MATTTDKQRSRQRKLSPGELLQLRQLADKSALRHASPGWRAISAQLTKMLPEKAGRNDVGVNVVPGAGGGGAHGWYSSELHQIVVDGKLLPCEPSELRPHTNRNHFDSLSVFHGVFCHEAGHAAHSLMLDYGPDAEDAWVHAAGQLEEIRMEARVAEDQPRDVRWIRAAMQKLHKGPMTGTVQMFAGLGVPPNQQVAYAALYTLGRVHAGTLSAADVSEFDQLLRSYIGDDKADALNGIFERATKLADAEQQDLLPLGRELCELFPPQGQKGGGGGGAAGGEAGEEGDGEGELSKDEVEELLGAAAGALDDASEQAQDEISGDGESREEIERLSEKAKAREQIEQTQQKVQSRTAGTPGGEQPGRGERRPNDDERKARTQLSRKLREVRWRDRQIVKRNSVLPPGRMRGREMVQQRTDHARGIPSLAEPWRQRHSRHVDMPVVTCAVLSDTSGSMGGTEDGLESSLWVLANAIADNGGRTGGYAFGDGIERVLAPEGPPRFVTTFNTGGGTAGVSGALDMAEEDMRWEKAYGPRLLVIVSDGAWGDTTQTADALLRLKAKGVKVLLVGVHHPATDYGMPELFDAQLTISTPLDLAKHVGKAAVRELANY